MKARKYVAIRHFEGELKRSDFEIEEYELPTLAHGEILVKTEWISVDPYLRVLNNSQNLPYDQFSYQVGTVEESKNSDFPVGSRVVSFKGWCDYYVINPNLNDSLYKPYMMPDLNGLSTSLSIGAAGTIGATAYFGFLEICQPKPGETVVVNTAAGAVGSIVGQIAKIKGCRVIGFTGSDAKVKWLEELSFDGCYNYKTDDIHKALNESAPNGVDCFFDNVGDEISNVIIGYMNHRGRIAVCGCISTYNADIKNLPKITNFLPNLLIKELRMEGILTSRWRDRFPEAFVELIKWIRSGQLKVKEHVIEGFDNICDAFILMMAGENIGKTVVKV